MKFFKENYVLEREKMQFIFEALIHTFLRGLV